MVPVAGFFALAFGITWALQALVITERLPAALDLPLLALAGCGPTLAALLLDRRRALSSLRSPISLPFLALAACVPFCVRLVLLLLGRLLPWGQAPESPPLLLAVGTMLLPPLGEELGWRGLALPTLTQRIGVLPAALLVSLAWALWHLPTAFFPGASPADFPLYALAVFSGGLFIAAVQRRGGGNVALALAAHAAMNAAAVLLPSAQSPQARLVGALLWLGVAIASARQLR